MLTNFTNGQKYCTTNAPTASYYPRTNPPSFRVGDFRPFRDSFCVTVQSQEMISSLVTALLLFCRPSNISFFIISIVVDSFNRMLWRWFSANFGKKVLKRIETEFNATPTIMLKTIKIWIIASGFGVIVCAVFRCKLTVCGFTVNSISNTFSAKTSTRFKFAMRDACAFSSQEITTTTTAKPNYATNWCLGKQANNGQTIKYLTSQISKVVVSWFKRIKGNDKVDFSHIELLISLILVRIGKALRVLSQSVFILPQNSIKMEVFA